MSVITIPKYQTARSVLLKPRAHNPVRSTASGVELDGKENVIAANIEGMMVIGRSQDFDKWAIERGSDLPVSGAIETIAKEVFKGTAEAPSWEEISVLMSAIGWKDGPKHEEGAKVSPLVGWCAEPSSVPSKEDKEEIVEEEESEAPMSEDIVQIEVPIVEATVTDVPDGQTDTETVIDEG
jgi:hypothetical protein